jgi:hypothetical protein
MFFPSKIMFISPLMHKYLFILTSLQNISSVQMKPWAGKALETVNCCAFLKRRLIGAC